MTTKPGYRTTEFWVTMFGSLLNLANLFGVWNWATNWQGGILLTVLGAAYAVSRGMAKRPLPL
jgi:hypothetical protein